MNYLCFLNDYGMLEKCEAIRRNSERIGHCGRCILEIPANIRLLDRLDRCKGVWKWNYCTEAPEVAMKH